MMLHDVKISRKGRTKTIQMVRPPRIGKKINVAGEMWQVISVMIEIPYRTSRARSSRDRVA